MIGLLIWAIIFVVSLFVLVKASEFFIDSAEKIGLYFGLPIFVIGVTIVAIGTSLPELVLSVIAVLRQSSEMVIGTVVGSNIANIFLVLGLTAIFSKKFIKVNFELIHVDLPLLIGAAFFLAATIWDGVFTLPEALMCLAAVVIYIAYTMNVGKKEREAKLKKVMKKRIKRERKRLETKTIIILVVAAALIFFGAKYTVEAVINLSEILNIGKEIIAVTAIAMGTSLPELAVCVSAARKGKPEIAVGNVLGSNIFNTLAVIGIPALFGTLIVPKTILFFALPIMVIATLIFFFMAQDKEITRWEGWFLLLFYILFFTKMIGLF